MPDAAPAPSPRRSAAELLRALRHRGAHHLEAVSLRSNRRTIWSLTRGGARFNLHRAFAGASGEVLDDLAVIAREARRRTDAYRAAARRIAEWPVLVTALRELQGGRAEGRTPSAPCCATPEQRSYLLALYRDLNVRRFGTRLPDRIALRLSSRMRSRLGQMVPGTDEQGRRYVREIALNADLMLPENDDIRTETLLHEMAHVADLLEHGRVGHGPTWRAIARQVGCEPRACCTGSIRRRRAGAPPSTRVPPLPRG